MGVPTASTMLSLRRDRVPARRGATQSGEVRSHSASEEPITEEKTQQMGAWFSMSFMVLKLVVMYT